MNTNVRWKIVQNPMQKGLDIYTLSAYNYDIKKQPHDFMEEENMKKIIAFLKMSNRYKHLIGGLMVGLLGFTPWTAFYAAAIAASCLELKDTLRGSPWDWIDWGLTVAGGSISVLFWMIV